MTTRGILTMSEDRCPYNGTCPHVALIRKEVEKVDNDVDDLRTILRSTNRTLYFIAGIISLHLGLVIL